MYNFFGSLYDVNIEAGKMLDLAVMNFYNEWGRFEKAKEKFNAVTAKIRILEQSFLMLENSLRHIPVKYSDSYTGNLGQAIRAFVPYPHNMGRADFPYMFNFFQIITPQESPNLNKLPKAEIVKNALLSAQSLDDMKVAFESAGIYFSINDNILKSFDVFVSNKSLIAPYINQSFDVMVEFIKAYNEKYQADMSYQAAKRNLENSLAAYKQITGAAPTVDELLEEYKKPKVIEAPKVVEPIKTPDVPVVQEKVIEQPKKSNAPLLIAAALGAVALFSKKG